MSKADHYHFADKEVGDTVFYAAPGSLTKSMASLSSLRSYWKKKGVEFDAVPTEGGFTLTITKQEMPKAAAKAKRVAGAKKGGLYTSDIRFWASAFLKAFDPSTAFDVQMADKFADQALVALRAARIRIKEENEKWPTPSI